MKIGFKFSNIVLFLIGSEDEFEPDHRYLNIASFFCSFCFLLSAFWDAVISLGLTNIVYSFVGLIIAALSYLLSRFGKKKRIAAILLIGCVIF